MSFRPWSRSKARRDGMTQFMTWLGELDLHGDIRLRSEAESSIMAFTQAIACKQGKARTMLQHSSVGSPRPWAVQSDLQRQRPATPECALRALEMQD